MSGPQEKYVRLVVHPVTLTEAKAFVNRHHRHHRAPQGGLFAIGCAIEGNESPCGVVIVGRPVARMLDTGFVAEVTRLCTLGQLNACSLLYRHAWRAAKAMGYQKLITYTLLEEGGSSLRAAGAKLIGEAGGGSWNSRTRPRVDKHPLQKKIRWEFSDD